MRATAFFLIIISTLASSTKLLRYLNKLQSSIPSTYPENNDLVKFRTCLQNTLISPQYLFWVEGFQLTLDCDHCTPQNSKVSWTIISFEGKEMPILNSSDYTVTSNSLQINSQPSQLSTYVCYWTNNIITTPSRIVTVELSPVASLTRATIRSWKRTKTDKQMTLPSGIKISMLWTDWSACSKCDRVGKSHQFGYCAVQHTTTPTTQNSLATYSTPISCSLFLELEPDFISETTTSLMMNVTHALAQDPVIIVGYCKVHCASWNPSHIPQQIRNVYSETHRLRKKPELSRTRNILNMLARATVVSWSTLPEIICLGGLLGLQIFVIIGIIRNKAQ